MSAAGLRTAVAALALLAPALTHAEESAWFEVQRLVASSGGSVRFGQDIAADREAVAIASNGGVDVLVRGSEGWTLQERVPRALLEDDPNWIHFGLPQQTVAIANGTLVVGTPPQNEASIYVRQGASWQLQQQLAVEQAVRFGASVAVSGDLVAIGAPSAQLNQMVERGAVYVYSRTGMLWMNEQALAIPLAESPRGSFGSDVAVSGDFLVSGHASSFSNFLFTRAGSSWSMQVLPAPAMCGTCGSQMRVAADGDTLALTDSFTDIANAAYPSRLFTQVYVREGAGWREEQVLIAAPSAFPDVDDSLASGVALSGDLLAVVGGDRAWRRAVYLYQRAAGTWTQRQTIGPSEPWSSPFHTYAVAISDRAIFLAAQHLSIDDVPNQGVVFVYELRKNDGARCSDDRECGRRRCLAGVCCASACGPCGDCESGKCVARTLGSTPAAATCGAYLCDGASTECSSRCASNRQCADGSRCSAATCVPKRPRGEACAGADECASGVCGPSGTCQDASPLGAACAGALDCRSGVCADGVCCDRECGGQCEACDVPEAPGVCAPIRGEPRPAREPCAGAGTPCAGHCEGDEPNACVYPGSDAMCGASCSNDRETIDVCDGAGACLPGAARACPGQLTCADDRVCNRECRENEDCIENHVCSEGACTSESICRDAHTEEGPSGRKDCRPYRCSDVACSNRCRSVDDCAESYVCNAGHRCVARLAQRAKADGCAANGASSDAQRPWLFGMLLLARRLGRKNRQTAH